VTLEALLLDLDGTLVDRDGALLRWAGARARAAGLDAAEAAEVALRALEDDRRSASSAPDRVGAALSARWPALGGGPALGRALRRELPAHVRPAPAVTATLEGLRGLGLRLAVVTNGEGAAQRAKLARAGLEGLVDAVVVSGEVGVSKPAAALFERALAALGLGAAQALHLGDDPVRDVDGARRAGLTAWWVARGRSWPRGLPPPARVVDEVSPALVDLVRSARRASVAS
jgi:HAD superfamily hydrolase (TIGR01509 family)